MKIAVIPARGGSKRIPKKNIKLFDDLPIIVYSIKAALGSKLFDRVVVSTDNQEIADVALKYGASVPFLRPDDLSDDFTGTRQIANHCRLWYEKQGVDVSYTCCLYATAPFVTTADLISSFEQLSTNPDKRYCVAVTEFEYPPQRGFTIDSGSPEMIMPQHLDTRSQDLPTVFHDAGQFYWTKVTPDWKDESMLASTKTLPFCLPRYQVQDIDTHDDWVRAEAMFQALKTIKRD